jgi:acetyl esterase/lipase
MHASKFIFFRVILCFLPLMSSSPAQARQEIPVWGEQIPPYSKPHSVTEFEAPCWGDVICVKQVVNPTLALYLPEGKSNDSMVLVLPGGGYEVEAVYHEGYEIAEALASRGTVAAVLKYRLPNPLTSTRPELAPLADVRQALHLLRMNQSDYGFSASRVGVMGFSAGSHLAAFASVNRSVEPSQNPDFSILVYGVTRLTPENELWLENTLYHRPLNQEERAAQTLLERIDENTPPAFLVHAYDDETCHFTESTLYAEALERHGVGVEMHLFARGGHGFGLGRSEDGTDQWIDLAVSWLDRMGSQQGEG